MYCRFKALGFCMFLLKNWLPGGWVRWHFRVDGGQEHAKGVPSCWNGIKVFSKPILKGTCDYVIPNEWAKKAAIGGKDVRSTISWNTAILDLSCLPADFYPQVRLFRLPIRPLSTNGIRLSHPADCWYVAVKEHHPGVGHLTWEKEI